MTSALLQPSRHDVYDFIDPTKGLKGAAEGKTVLITGAGAGGIGRGIAEAFALAGATSLILAARRIEPLETTKAGISELVPDCNIITAGGVDVSKQFSVEKLFSDLSTLPDVVVSNAAISGGQLSVADSDPTTWSSVIDINVKGAYLVARTYIRSMREAKKKGGRIINVSSNNAWRYIPGLSAYGASKIALNTLTEYIDN